MKIIRYADPQGKIHHAATQADGSHREIEGDIFGAHTVSNRAANVARLLAPIQPSVIFCIGLNYRRHAEETKSKIPQWPVLFMKSPAAVQNPGEPVLLPTKLKSTQVDYECELAVVIGKAGKNIPKAQALQHVLGYTCANDISARDWQKDFGGSQWCRGKTFDTFCPLGPQLVTRDEIPNPNALKIKTILNGEAVQDWTTDDMIFDIPTLIEFLSGSTTLPAGAVILTGTPHGVGVARQPQLFLKHGDTVSVEIEKIGVLTNPVLDEPA